MSSARAAFKENRKSERVCQASPYARHNAKSSWTIASFWKWISSGAQDATGNVGGPYDTDSTPTGIQARETTTPNINFMPGSAATTLANRGRSMQERLESSQPSTSRSESGASGSTSGAPRLKPLIPRSNVPVSESAPDVGGGDLESTREWLVAKVKRGEDIKASEAANLLGVLTQVQPTRQSFRDKLQQPRFTLASHRNSPTNLALRGSSPRLLRTNPNGPVSYRGLSNTSSPVRRRLPLATQAHSVFNTENGSPFLTPDGKRRRTNIDLSSPPNGSYSWSTPATMDASHKPPASQMSVAQSSTSKRPFAATVEDDPDDGYAPPTTSLAGIIHTPTSSGLSPATFGPQTSASKSRGFATPQMPSPLRHSTQTHGSPRKTSDSNGELAGSAKSPTPLAYEIMSDIIKEATTKTPFPPKLKHTSVINPYQSSSIVTPRQIRKIPAPKLSETALKPVPPPPQQKKQMVSTGNSFLDYTAASAPNATKNARVGFASTEVRGQEQSAPPVKGKALASEAVEVDELDDDDLIIIENPIRPTKVVEPSTKAPPVSNGIRDAPKGLFAAPSVTTAKPTKPLHKTPFFPKEPSPLRQSFAPSPNTSQYDLSNADSPAATPSEAALSAKAAKPENTKKPRRLTKEEIIAFPVDLLPKFEFHWPDVKTKTDPATIARIQAIPIDKLPVFHFPDDDSGCHAHVKATSDTITESTSPSQPGAASFDWAASGLKQPSIGGWHCSTCGLENKSTEKVKCTICDAPAPASAASKPAQSEKGFDSEAAGLKGETSTGRTCNVCGVNNLNDRVNKCVACESLAPRKPPTGTGFDWAAAGMTPPSGSKDSWTCALCGLKNSGSEKVKCSTCETPFPASPKSSVSN